MAGDSVVKVRLWVAPSLLGRRAAPPGHLGLTTELAFDALAQD